MLKLCAIFMFIGLFTSVLGQGVEVESDSVTTADTLKIMKGGKVITPEYYAKRYQPRKALMYSAVLPGMGQIYNKKYWKLPFVYGGFAIITAFAVTYNNLYIKYKDELYSSLSDPTYSSPEGYTQEQLRSIIELTRRQRDFFLILDGMWYILQFVDAHVDAHLREFDLNPQLKVTLEPHTQYNGMIGRVSGVSLIIKF